MAITVVLPPPVQKKRGVDKRGVKSNEAYAREVLGTIANAQNILVINDEAHHAWRINPETKVKLSKEEKELEKEATIWVSGLDRIHAARKILTCYDFSATPFAPSGKKNDTEALFSWIVTDFGLNDGIESGLVKTPRVVVRDDGTPDAKTFRSKLYHIYTDASVKDDINRKAEPEEPLPDLITQAYYLLGKDWLETFKDWQKNKAATSPVMITVANRTETAARIKYAFEHKRIPVDELCEPDYLIHIDSKTLEKAESRETSDLDDTSPDTEGEEAEKKYSKKDAAAILRDTVNTVGQKGKRGEHIRNVISVSMLTEGWDAKTVTHILGLRAFSSQLLCEQVVGRGLRRTSYDIEKDMKEGKAPMYTPEYVNIFGIPFTFLPHETEEGGGGYPPKPKTTIEALSDRRKFEINWPNIIRINRELNPKLHIDISKIPTLTLDASQTRLRADMSPILNGQADLQKCTDIDLQKLEAGLRLQRIVFLAAGEVYEMMKDKTTATWEHEGTKFALLGQIIIIVEQYLKFGKIVVEPVLFETNPLRRKILCMANMNLIVQHLWSYIRFKHSEKIIPVFDPNKKVRSTADMSTWYTIKPNFPTKKSHISNCVFDSTWEAAESYVLEKNSRVKTWVKNDHVGFEIGYMYNGVFRKYYPDYLIKLDNGKILVLETKGQDSPIARGKRKALNEWIEAVNSIQDYGVWCSDISFNIADVDGIIEKHLK
ncbi:type III restriction endonuclease subunit R [Treponema endosymbiont of Eucomonympha sp.]|uniref:type III restriction endonuclease subunit R n=1 Tax=Treponema endosymbiont of Eucomonympha sp. TaxID=1580831 RepID=UPI00139698A5|nr:type III restriction endonuclease subunit R [Treponema endosymbiont of Eucomonympha sp.]